MSLQVAAILILSVVSCSGNPVTEFEDCGSTVGEINYIDITPCESSSRCYIPRGKSVALALNFTANAEITSAKTSIAGIINDNLYPFPVPLDACQHMNCPLQKGSGAFYNNSFFLSPVLPPTGQNGLVVMDDSFTIIKDGTSGMCHISINATAKFELLDQVDRRIICFTVDVQLAWG